MTRGIDLCARAIRGVETCAGGAGATGAGRWGFSRAWWRLDLRSRAKISTSITREIAALGRITRSAAGRQAGRAGGAVAAGGSNLRPTSGRAGTTSTLKDKKPTRRLGPLRRRVSLRRLRPPFLQPKAIA
jgi:hypothetical protein